MRRHELDKISDAFGRDGQVRHIAIHATTAFAGNLLEEARAG